MGSESEKFLQFSAPQTYSQKQLSICEGLFPQREKTNLFQSKNQALFLYVLVLSFVCVGYSVYCCSQGYRGSEWVWEGHQEEGEGNDSFPLASPKDKLATLKLRFQKL